MKTLLIVRHAKSDWTHIGQSDYDRTLSERGLRDAPAMALRLKERSFMPDLIVASTAARAAETARLLARGIEYDEERIQWEQDLYHAPAGLMRDILAQTPDTVNTLMLVAHNPGITDLANSFCGPLTDNVPTTGMAAFRLDLKHWADLYTAPATLFFYDYPKNGPGLS